MTAWLRWCLLFLHCFPFASLLLGSVSLVQPLLKCVWELSPAVCAWSCEASQVLVSQTQGPPVLSSTLHVETGEVEIPTESALEEERQVPWPEEHLILITYHREYV